MKDKPAQRKIEDKISHGGQPSPPRLRRNAITPSRRRYDGYEYDGIQVARPRNGSQKNHAAAEAIATSDSASASASAADRQKESKAKEQTQTTDEKDNIHYIRAGRRTYEDEDGDIPTQFIVVAKIDTAKAKVSWLSVATWQLNGLRIGTVGAGDRIREDDEIFGYVVGLNPDPFFIACNAGSPRGVRRILLGRLEGGEIGVREETLDDEVAQREREEAQYSRMLERHGPAVIDGGDKAVRAIAARGDAKLRFPHPWALPTALTRSRSCFPIGLEAFTRVAGDVAISSINVVATFVNEIDDGRDLRLKHFVQADFEPDETLESAKHYFLQGDEGAGFRGLENNEYLARKWWLLELWVLPHLKGCSVLYKWDNTPELTARAFCNAKALEDEEPKLYVEVRIVQDPDHLGGESEDDVDSNEDGA